MLPFNCQSLCDWLNRMAKCYMPFCSKFLLYRKHRFVFQNFDCSRRYSRCKQPRFFGRIYTSKAVKGL